MAAQNEDSGAFAAHLRSNENSPSLTDTETLTDGSVGDIEQDEELFKSQMRLTWATTEIDDLKKKLDETNKRATEAEARADRAEKAAKSDDDKTILTLQRQLRVAETSNADLEAKLERSCATVSARDAKIEQLADRYDALQVKYFSTLENSKKTQKDLSKDLEAKLEQSRVTLSARDAKIEQLADKYDTLQVKYFGILENCKKMQKELSDARENDRSTVLVARNLKLESEKVELRTRLENLRSDWERLQTEHARVLADISARPPSAQVPPNSRVHVGNSDQLDDVRDGTAWLISELDLATRGTIRVFDCQHANNRDIPDGNNSTYELSVARITEVLFELWEHDANFFKDYNHARRTMIAHHRAHEKANEGRGIAWYRMKKMFQEADEKRGVAPKY